MSLRSKHLTLLVSGMAVAFAASAFAGTDYYVYQKDGSSTCDISTKGPDAYNRGSSWSLVGSDSTRSGAKEIGEGAGCSSF